LFCRLDLDFVGYLVQVGLMSVNVPTALHPAASKRHGRFTLSFLVSVNLDDTDTA
jgi:hypothetical protein